MSRVGKNPVVIPAGVEVRIDADQIVVRGPKGELTRTLHPHVQAVAGDFEGQKAVTVTVTDPENTQDRALWGLFRNLIANMVTGVTQGFEKKLEVIGVGYKVSGGGKSITLDVGYSHDVPVAMPEGITAAVDKNTITLNGANNELLGQVAARIREIRKPEPYKGKGIKYIDEHIRRKAGKAAKAGAK